MPMTTDVADQQSTARPAPMWLVLQVAATLASHREGEALAGLFMSLLDGWSGETCEQIAEYVDLGRAVTRERRKPRMERSLSAVG